MIPKPDIAHDREREWAALSSFVSDPAEGPALGLVYGRRRQGKSFLLELLCEATEGFYHMALEQEAPLALASLGEDLARHTRAPGPIRLADWESAVEAVLGLGEGARPVPVVIDEFPYLMDRAPELPSIIQRALGSRSSPGGTSRVRLILCGSALSVMGRLLTGTAPLRGRASMDLMIQPFGFREAASFWGLEDDPTVGIRVHAVLGGTPAYRELLRGDRPDSVEDFDPWVVRSVLDPASALFREGRYLLAEEPGISDRALYHSVLSAVAAGATRPGQIAGLLGRPQGALTHPLNVLEDIRLIVRVEDALRRQRPVYRIAEPILRFHHAIIRPHLARLERGHGADVWRRDARPTFWSQVLGLHFEDLARTWTAEFAAEETIRGRPSLVGPTVVRDPSTRTSYEVDVVALGPPGRRGGRHVLALGEAKWSSDPVQEDELDRLIRIRRTLAAREDVVAARARPMLFSASGFSASLKRRARQEDAVLVDLERLYAGD